MTRKERYSAEWLDLRNCEITRQGADFEDVAFILDMTPPKDIYVQLLMVGNIMFCVNQATDETPEVRISGSMVNSRLGEYLNWSSGPAVLYEDDFDSAIDVDFRESSLVDFFPRYCKKAKVAPK